MVVTPHVNFLGLPEGYPASECCSAKQWEHGYGFSGSLSDIRSARLFASPFSL
jgi:hypothetical protein